MYFNRIIFNYKFNNWNYFYFRKCYVRVGLFLRELFDNVFGWWRGLCFIKLVWWGGLCLIELNIIDLIWRFNGYRIRLISLLFYLNVLFNWGSKGTIAILPKFMYHLFRTIVKWWVVCIYQIGGGSRAS